MRPLIGIVGYGVVGKAMHRLFPDALVYDVAPVWRTQGFCLTVPQWASRSEIDHCDYVFICVPTPCADEGRLDVSAVEDVLSWCQNPTLIIRSTVNPGDCARWVHKYGIALCYQPEYLGETTAHPFADMSERPFIIIGAEFPGIARRVIRLYQTVYNANVRIRQMSLAEAEVVKLSENRAIAFKVAQCQELYDACEAAGVDYYAVREAVYGDDPRFNLWHTFVYPDQRGMNSKCIPKDVYAWAAWAESCGVRASITRAILARNKEWLAENLRDDDPVGVEKVV